MACVLLTGCNHQRCVGDTRVNERTHRMPQTACSVHVDEACAAGDCCVAVCHCDNRSFLQSQYIRDVLHSIQSVDQRHLGGAGIAEDVTHTLASENVQHDGCCRLWRILRALQRDGRLQNVDLARQVGLSASPCLRRVRRLESEGIIEPYTALLSAAKIGVGLTVFARISLISQDAEAIDQFAATIRKLPQVVEAHIMAGECDALLRVVAADLDAYREFQSTHLTRKNGIQTVKTDIPMQRIKLSTELPL